MTDKKQIEEMAVICGDCKNSCDKCFDEYEKTIWQNEIKKVDRADHCQAILHAKRLYNAGYRKLPENAVVVMPDKLDEYQKAELKIITDQTRKETASEILKGLSSTKIKICNDYYIFAENIDVLAKQYGVEIEE